MPTAMITNATERSQRCTTTLTDGNTSSLVDKRRFLPRSNELFLGKLLFLSDVRAGEGFRQHHASRAYSDRPYPRHGEAFVVPVLGAGHPDSLEAYLTHCTHWLGSNLGASHASDIRGRWHGQ